jgi:hypothetical protein
VADHLFGKRVRTQSRREADQGSPQSEGNYTVQAQLRQTQTSFDPKTARVFGTILLRLIGGYTYEGGRSKTASKDFKFMTIGHVTGAPEKTEEPPKLPDDLLRHNVYFEAENQEHLSGDELRRLEDRWADPLQQRVPELYEGIKSGGVEILLTGYASSTGGDKMNETLSAKRISSVEQALKRDLFGSTNIKIRRDPKGKSDTTQTGRVTRERRVEIYISSADALNVMKAQKAK